MKRYEFTYTKRDIDKNVTVIDTKDNENYEISYYELQELSKYLSEGSKIMEQIDILKDKIILKYGELNLDVTGIDLLDLRRVRLGDEHTLSLCGEYRNYGDSLLYLKINTNDGARLQLYNLSNYAVDFSDSYGQVNSLDLASYSKYMFPRKPVLDVKTLNAETNNTTYTGKINKVGRLSVTGTVSGYHKLLKHILKIERLGKIDLTMTQKNAVCTMPKQIEHLEGKFEITIFGKDTTLTIDMQNIELFSSLQFIIRENYACSKFNIDIIIRNLNCAFEADLRRTVSLLKIDLQATKCYRTISIEVPHHLRERLGKDFLEIL